MVLPRWVWDYIRTIMEGGTYAELRGWFRDPVAPRHSARPTVSEVSSPCPTKRDAYLRRVTKIPMEDTEVLSMRVRRLMINLGRGRRLPAFNGVAEYVTYTDRPGLFRLLLDVANAYGVGKNRALGLGYVNVDVLGQHLLR